MKDKNRLKSIIGGVAIGITNGLFGAGGGIIAVPVLQSLGLDKKEAHANAVAVILPISILSGILYMVKGYVEFSQALPFIPTGIIGAALGTYCLKKISPLVLKRVFGIFIIYAGVRLLIK